MVVFCRHRRSPRSTRTDTLLPSTALVRSGACGQALARGRGRRTRIFTPQNQDIHAKSLSVGAQQLANSAIAKNTQSLAIQRTSNLADRIALMPCTLLQAAHVLIHVDRKSTRLNSSH